MIPPLIKTNQLTRRDKMNILKQWRTDNSLTQTEAAKILGYKSYVSVSYFESGARKIPNRLMKMIKLLE